MLSQMKVNVDGDCLIVSLRFSPGTTEAGVRGNHAVKALGGRRPGAHSIKFTDLQVYNICKLDHLRATLSCKKLTNNSVIAPAYYFLRIYKNL